MILHCLPGSPSCQTDLPPKFYGHTALFQQPTAIVGGAASGKPDSARWHDGHSATADGDRAQHEPCQMAEIDPIAKCHHLHESESPVPGGGVVADPANAGPPIGVCPPAGRCRTFNHHPVFYFDECEIGCAHTGVCAALSGWR
ncbi:hypothetical protein DESC_290157 [Desulfosarcina cetonica]|nr:hypothetical protein DESC_290157 [Desulfosarcina cetonica]